MNSESSNEPVPSIRIDKWLWYARFLKTRSLASKFAEAGRIRQRRDSAAEDESVRVTKPNHIVHPGDVLTFPLGRHIRVIKVLQIGVRRGPAPEARELYEDLAPLDQTPSEPEVRADPPGLSAGRRPTKKERRDITKLKTSS